MTQGLFILALAEGKECKCSRFTGLGSMGMNLLYDHEYFGRLRR